MGDAQLTTEESAALSLDIIACAAAEAFTEAYYYTLEKDRASIPSFYCPPNVATDSTTPFIAWNGEVYNDGPSFQAHFELLTHTHFEVEGLDCNIINPKYLPASEVKNGSNDDAKDLDRRMSICVVVMGSVRLEEQLKGPMREFSETFVLIPDKEKLPKENPTFEKGWAREWVIQTQNFRFTEWGAKEVPRNKMEDVHANKQGAAGKNKGIAGQFAAAGLFVKGKGKA